MPFLFLYDVWFDQKINLKILHPGFFKVFQRYQSHLWTDSPEIWYIHRFGTHVKHIERFFEILKNFDFIKLFHKFFDFCKFWCPKLKFLKIWNDHFVEHQILHVFGPNKFLIYFANRGVATVWISAWFWPKIAWYDVTKTSFFPKFSNRFR